jgi:hypothetical protein
MVIVATTLPIGAVIYSRVWLWSDGRGFRKLAINGLVVLEADLWPAWPFV